VKRVTATDAARKFSDLLDDVEQHGERFVVERRGRVIAQVIPAEAGNGRALKALIAENAIDAEWSRELEEVRADLPVQAREWPD
jgi:antitoxin (DNA-binding transcriptional repressor) of toxin-antitoxin stability system